MLKVSYRTSLQIRLIQRMVQWKISTACTVITAYKVAKSKRTDIVSTKNLSHHFECLVKMRATSNYSVRPCQHWGDWVRHTGYRTWQPAANCSSRWWPLVTSSAGIIRPIMPADDVTSGHQRALQFAAARCARRPPFHYTRWATVRDFVTQARPVIVPPDSEFPVVNNPTVTSLP